MHGGCTILNFPALSCCCTYRKKKTAVRLVNIEADIRKRDLQKEIGESNDSDFYNFLGLYNDNFSTSSSVGSNENPIR